MCPGSCAIRARVRAAPGETAHTPVAPYTPERLPHVRVQQPDHGGPPLGRRRCRERGGRHRRALGGGVVPQRVPDRRDRAGRHRQAGHAEPDEHEREHRVGRGLAADPDGLARPRGRPAPWRRPGRARRAATGRAGRPARRAAGRWPSCTARGRWCPARRSRPRRGSPARAARRRAPRSSRRPWRRPRRAPGSANARASAAVAIIGAMTHGVVPVSACACGERLRAGCPAARGASGPGGSRGRRAPGSPRRAASRTPAACRRRRRACGRRPCGRRTSAAPARRPRPAPPAVGAVVRLQEQHLGPEQADALDGAAGDARGVLGGADVGQQRDRAAVGGAARGGVRLERRLDARRAGPARHAARRPGRRSRCRRRRRRRRRVPSVERRRARDAHDARAGRAARR